MPAHSKKVRKNPLRALGARIRGLQLRRPHRSFRLTRYRDYNRSLKLPGYLAFTNEVRKTLFQYRKTFLLLALFYAVLSAFLVGIASQDLYSGLTETLRDSGGQVFEGNWGELEKAGLLLSTIITTGLSQNVSDAQQIFSVLLGLMLWLSTVWLLRNLLAGHKVKARDAVYNAGAPIISTLLVSLLLFVQLLPVAFAVLGYGAATSSGLLSGGVEAMLFWVAAGLLTSLSIYLIISTFFALIVVTLPGMYPMQAIRTAGDMVIGRRIRILLRLAWLALTIAVLWVIIMIPVILLDSWLKGVWTEIEAAPVIPITLLVLTTVSLMWGASYIYLLYRKVVDDDADPA